MERLAEVGWQSSDAAYGHGGDHLGGTSPAYVRHRIATVTWGRHPDVAAADGSKSPSRERKLAGI
jgi:hypothetical protein